MRKLNRAACPAPPCLAGYHQGMHGWQDVEAIHKEEIRKHLEAMQGKRCAYCEGDIEVLGQHIEHFRRKSAHPALTFVWSNLYWSCDQHDSCGHHKDNGAGPYAVADLIDPCLEDPDKFFVFRSNGTISIPADLSAEEVHRARETLRVLSLDADRGRLRVMRQIAVAGYVRDADEAFSAGFSPDEIRGYFAEVLESVEGLPFYTTIRHVLTKRQE